ncbi:MAG: SCO family protein [Vicinamibacterales bacterium]
MIRIVVYAGAIAVIGAGLVSQGATATPALPFYDSADLTPRWAQSSGHRIADFALTTQTGAAITRRDLVGNVHVASFIYTRCAGICPAMVTQLSKVQAAVANRNAVLVSYSVTPGEDTPESLAAFGTLRGIDPERWRLVTGDAEQIYSLARSSYFADDGRLVAGKSASEQFLHTEKVLLVDQAGHLRGVYNATLPHEIDKLLDDLDLLLDTGS